MMLKQVFSRSMRNLRGFRPSLEVVENRELLASGFLQGVVLANGVPVAGAKVQLSQPANPLFTPQTFTTGANGNYSFTGLVGGNYRLTEIVAPTGTVPNGVQALSPIDPYSNLTPNSVDVTVIDPDLTPVIFTYV